MMPDVTVKPAFELTLDPYIQCPLLASWGRFGNQLFQYAFVKLLAAKHGRTFRAPIWNGAQLFHLVDIPCEPALEMIREDTADVNLSKIALGQSLPTIWTSITGIFQYHTSYYRDAKHIIEGWYQPFPELEEMLQTAMDHLTKKGTLVAIHLRRGDYVQLSKQIPMFFIPPDQWYMDWLDTFWHKLYKPILYIASDGQIPTCFAKYNPKIADDLNIADHKRFGFYIDFWMLTQAQHLAISNSTFSFWAAMLNSGMDSEPVRPSMTKRGLLPEMMIPFDPWNSDPLLHRSAV